MLYDKCVVVVVLLFCLRLIVALLVPSALLRTACFAVLIATLFYC